MNNPTGPKLEQAHNWEERTVSEDEAIHMGFTPYHQYGSYYKAKGDMLLFNPMDKDGGMDLQFMDGDPIENPVEVDMGTGEEAYRVYRELGGIEL